jgi:hypothetical protein
VIAITQERMTPHAAAHAMNTQVAQISRASAQPAAEIFFDESLSPLSSMDLKEIRRLARFLPVMVFIPRSTREHQLSPHKPSVAKPSQKFVAA